MTANSSPIRDLPQEPAPCDADLAGAGVFCAIAIATLLPVAAYQLGWVKHLSDPPGDLWDSDRITGSRTAHPLGIPDALLGLASYGASLGLLIAAPRSDTARLLLPWKLGLDGAAAAFNAGRQVVKFGKMCSWCTGTGLATAGMVCLGLRPFRCMQARNAYPNTYGEEEK